MNVVEMAMNLSLAAYILEIHVVRMASLIQPSVNHIHGSGLGVCRSTLAYLALVTPSHSGS